MVNWLDAEVPVLSVFTVNSKASFTDDPPALELAPIEFEIAIYILPKC